MKRTHAPSPTPRKHANTQAIPGWEGAELSSLAWARDALGRRWRLFAGSLDGSIYEVDFESQRVAHASDSYGGAVWALAAAPAAGAQAGGGGGGGVGDKAGGAGGEEGGHDLVAACDDGSLRLLRVNGGVSGCEYVRPLAKAEGRALAVAWHPGGGAVVSGGSDGCIHAWDVKTGARRGAARRGCGTEGRAGLCRPDSRRAYGQGGARGAGEGAALPRAPLVAARSPRVAAAAESGRHARPTSPALIWRPCLSLPPLNPHRPRADANHRVRPQRRAAARLGARRAAGWHHRFRRL